MSPGLAEPRTGRGDCSRQLLLYLVADGLGEAVAPFFAAGLLFADGLRVAEGRGDTVALAAGAGENVA